jgi:ADP-glucose pyrophosphorylase
VVENSVLWDGVTVGSDCTVRRSILGSSVTLAEKAEVMDQSLIGE